jgi:hypothetical protein
MWFHFCVIACFAVRWQTLLCLYSVFVLIEASLALLNGKAEWVKSCFLFLLFSSFLEAA